MHDGAVVINAELNTKKFDAQIEELEDKLNDIDILLSDTKELSPDEFIKLNAEAERLRNKIADLVNKKEELNRPPSNLRDFFADMGNNISENIKKVKRLVLGIFGIRGAYMAIRNAMSIITQDDAQLKADIDYIKAVLAYALEPIVRGIVDLVKTIVAYVGYIVNAWFGINIFEKAHNKMMKQDVGYAQQTTKEMKKQLASFDEMNTLQSETGGGGAGGGGGATPDFSSFENPEIPYWIDWIAHNKDIVLGFLAGIAGIIAGMKIAKFVSRLLQIWDFLKAIPKLKAIGVIAGLAITIDGIYKTITNIIKFIENPSWSNFNSILGGISETLGGIGIALVALNLTNPVGWLAIIGAYVVDNTKQLSEMFRILVEGKANIKDVKDAQDELNQSIKNAYDAEDNYYKALDKRQEMLDKVKQLEDQLKESDEELKLSGEELHEEVRNGTLKYEDLSPKVKELYWAYVDLQKQEDIVKTSAEKMGEAQDIVKEKTVDAALSAYNETGDWEAFADAISKMADEGSADVDDLKTAVEKAMSKMDTDTANTFKTKLPNSIQEGLDANRYKASAWDLVNTIGNILGHLGGAGGLVQNIIWGVSNAFGHAKGGIIVPKLARGGVINNPGRGVPLVSAVGGEHGAEGVIPLTDSQQMALLGEAIGRYITINANIVNEMNGRVISRELKQVQNNSDFAYNR